MTAPEPPPFPPEDSDDMAAAEYALGALPHDVHMRLARRVETDPAFAKLVGAWEDHLSLMSDGFTPADVPAHVKKSLDLRLFGQPNAPARGIWNSLVLWRGLAGAAALALVIALALPVVAPHTTPTLADHLAGSLTAAGSNVTYLVLYDSATGEVSLAHLSGDAVAGRDFQLWVAQGAEAPVSLGVIPAATSTRVTVDAATRDLMTSAAHMAISLEPPGGSPTGQPTGPVLAVGDLLDI